MNNSVLSVVGFAALLGIAKKGSFSKEELKSDLQKYFEIPPSKNIPKSYLKNELARLTVLPPELRTEKILYM